MQLTTGLKALALGVVLVTTSACKDDDNDSFSFGLDSTQNSPPIISGTPRTKARAGERYQFTPRATDPTGSRSPSASRTCLDWLSFDAGSGRISGTPRSSNVGSFEDVTHLRIRRRRAQRRWRRSASASKRLRHAVDPPPLGAAGFAAGNAVGRWPVPFRGDPGDRVRPRLPRDRASRDLPSRHAQPLDARRPAQRERLEAARRDPTRGHRRQRRRRELRLRHRAS